MTAVTQAGQQPDLRVAQGPNWLKWVQVAGLVYLLLVAVSLIGGGFKIAQILYEILEILCLSEIPIDRGKTHETDLIQVFQILHDHLPDRFCRDLTLAGCFQLALNAVDNAFDPLRVDRTLTQSDP